MRSVATFYKNGGKLLLYRAGQHQEVEMRMKSKPNMYKSVTKALQEEGYTHLLPKCGSLDEALVQYYCMAEEPKTEWKPIKKGQGGNKHTTTQTRTHTHEHTNTHTHIPIHVQVESTWRSGRR